MAAQFGAVELYDEEKKKRRRKKGNENKMSGNMKLGRGMGGCEWTWEDLKVNVHMAVLHVEEENQ